jgi:hypothetical protein
VEFYQYLLLEWISHGTKFASEITCLNCFSLSLLAGIITERSHVMYHTQQRGPSVFRNSKATLLSKHTMKVQGSGELCILVPEDHIAAFSDRKLTRLALHFCIL